MGEDFLGNLTELVLFQSRQKQRESLINSIVSIKAKGARESDQCELVIRENERV